MPPARTLVFLDASVLVAASRSPSGGSAVAIEVCQGRRYRAVVTRLVLLEARSNIAKKFGEEDLARFYRQLAAMQPEIAPAPLTNRLAECAPLTTEKDAHVLAAALDCRSSYLLTLDRRHLLTPVVQEAGLPLEVMMPGDFLRRIVAEQR